MLVSIGKRQELIDLVHHARCNKTSDVSMVDQILMRLPDAVTPEIQGVLDTLKTWVSKIRPYVPSINSWHTDLIKAYDAFSPPTRSFDMPECWIVYCSHGVTFTCKTLADAEVQKSAFDGIHIEHIPTKTIEIPAKG